MFGPMYKLPTALHTIDFAIVKSECRHSIVSQLLLQLVHELSIMLISP